MIKRWVRLLVVGACALAFTFLLVRHYYVLDSASLERAIKKELPPGTSKVQVVEFIQRRRPMFLDDLGLQVKARLSGRADNLIYRRDIVLTFDFDSNGRLMSYSEKVYLSFI